MHTNEVIEMMNFCKSEIQSLRRANAELAPKADAYDSIRTILNLMPARPQGYAEDVVWRLEKRIKELQAEQEAEKAKAERMSQGD